MSPARSAQLVTRRSNLGWERRWSIEIGPASCEVCYNASIWPQTRHHALAILGGRHLHPSGISALCILNPCSAKLRRQGPQPSARQLSPATFFGCRSAFLIVDASSHAKRNLDLCSINDVYTACLRPSSRDEAAVPTSGYCTLIFSWYPGRWLPR